MNEKIEDMKPILDKEELYIDDISCGLIITKTENLPTKLVVVNEDKDEYNKYYHLNSMPDELKCVIETYGTLLSENHPITAIQEAVNALKEKVDSVLES